MLVALKLKVFCEPTALIIWPKERYSANILQNAVWKYKVQRFAAKWNVYPLKVQIGEEKGLLYSNKLLDFLNVSLPCYCLCCAF